MKISKAKLQEALEIVKPGLANKELIQQATSFAFINGKVVTYNDEISISYPLDLQLEGAVRATNLYQLLSKIKKDEIEISVVENEIVLQSGRTKAGLTLESEIKLPLDEEISKKGKWKELPEDFIHLLGFAMSACGKDMSKPVLTCVHVSKEGILEASDDFRVTRCQLKTEMPTKSFLMPASAAVDVIRMHPIRIAEGKGWVHFQTAEEAIISCRILEDPFPSASINSIIKVKGIQLNLPRTIQEVLDRASVFAKREHLLDESVDITIETHKFIIRSKSDIGWFEEELNLQYKGDTIQFNITPYLLKDILSETLVCTLSADKLKFEGEGWIYVTALRHS